MKKLKFRVSESNTDKLHYCEIRFGFDKFKMIASLRSMKGFYFMADTGRKDLNGKILYSGDYIVFLGKENERWEVFTEWLDDSMVFYYRYNNQLFPLKDMTNDFTIVGNIIEK